MKRIVAVIALLCFLVASMGVMALAENVTSYSTYSISGEFADTLSEQIISVFVLKEGYTMNDLSAGSVRDKVYYTNMYKTGENGTYEIAINLPSHVKGGTVVLSCNGMVQEKSFRDLLVEQGLLTVIYASPDGTASSTGGTINRPWTLKMAKDKAITYAKDSDVLVLLYGGKYNYEASRIQLEKANQNTGHTITFAPVSKDDKPIITSMKEVNHQYITKLTEGDIYNRIPESARGMVYKLDMKAAGFADGDPIISSTTGQQTGTYTVLSMNYAGESASHRTIDPPILYLNGKRQRMSQYPNEKTVAFDNEKDIVGTNANGNPTLSYAKFIEQMNFDKWTTAREDAFLTGYVFDSYRTAAVKITDIDTTNKKITIDGTRAFYYPNPTWNPRFGPRLAIVNLPEEMDIPGEYYFCTADKCIYYYAPYELTADDVFEMANDRRSSDGKWGYGELVFITGTDNVTFEDIEFYGSRYKYAVYISGSNNITFRNCTIHATATAGMSASGSNITVENCNIYDVGTNGISIKSLKPITKDVSVNGGNIVRNNHIYKYAQNPTYGYASNGITFGGSDSETVDGEYIVYKSLGDTVENNLIHASKFAGGLRVSGLRHTIKRNEIYNLLQSTDDIGAVYIGRSLTEFGNNFTENYIHDFHSIANPRYSTMGIYWDDYMSGQTGTRNIVVAPGDPTVKTDLLGLRTIGYDNRVYSNTFVNINIGVGLSGRSPSTFTSQNSEWGLTNALSKYMPAPEYERRADMETLLNLYNTNGNKMVHMAKVENNLMVNCVKPITRSSNTDGRIYEYGNDNVHDNEENTYDMSIFVDPENQDYRVKKSAITSGTLSTVVNEENFDMDWIGVQTKDKMPESDKSFKLMHPTKGETLTKDSVILSWEQGLFADEYEYVIATDKDFANIVETGETIETFIIPTATFTEGTTYYWKVRAKNGSRNMGSEWNCDKVESFTVAKEVNMQTVEATVLSEDGSTIIRTLNGVQNFDFKYKVKNNGASAQAFVVIAALFSDEGKFQQAKVAETATVSAGSIATGTLEFFNSTPAKDGYCVKVFVVDSKQNIKPLTFLNEILGKR